MSHRWPPDDERQPLVLEVVKPPVVVRRVEVNEGAAPNKTMTQEGAFEVL
jgi:hypothetical protein